MNELTKGTIEATHTYKGMEIFKWVRNDEYRDRFGTWHRRAVYSYEFKERFGAWGFDTLKEAKRWIDKGEKK